jgi:UDP-N-acetylmuramyl pentapeptide phosphotransferase/UDP-N-acetylglucosamine-1-phosphate transferase
MPFEFLVPGLAAFLLTAIVLHVLLLWARRFLPVDIPNGRSLHTRPTPRFGGLAMLVGAAAALALCGGLVPTWLWPIPILAATSLLDDFLSLSAVPRFLIQIAVATAYAVFLSIDLVWLLPVVLATVWMTNLYNFMDGSDGLAGGMTFAGFAAYATVAASAGDHEIAVVCLAVCGAALAFLLRNRHPASVFMGDAGSIPLGFLAAAVGAVGLQRGLWDLWLPALVFLVFIADATVTLLRRLWHGERVWLAHSTHYYQRMIRMGIGHVGTARVYFLTMAGCAVSAVFIQLTLPTLGMTALLAWCAVLAVLGLRIDALWARHSDAGAWPAQ